MSVVPETDVLGMREARQRFAEVLDRVHSGEHVVVARRGEPIAAIVPIPPSGDEPRGLAAFAGAMSRRDQLDETVAMVVATRSIARDRNAPEVE
ncbi:MAG TPA: type II toxin-antitoxin system prevent-host-death family antitoxin [Gaiella sp.]|jgi:prevent-host-death family protein|nr:type II toxin-antitoxin system prevent-host-death family antitoxin [Gaiella sp.]